MKAMIYLYWAATLTTGKHCSPQRRWIWGCLTQEKHFFFLQICFIIVTVLGNLNTHYGRDFRKYNWVSFLICHVDFGPEPKSLVFIPVLRFHKWSMFTSRLCSDFTQRGMRTRTGDLLFQLCFISSVTMDSWSCSCIYPHRENF